MTVVWNVLAIIGLAVVGTAGLWLFLCLTVWLG